MKIRVLWVCLAGVLFVVVGAAAYFRASGRLELGNPALLRSDPAIDYPAKLDMGERENGDRAVARFTIANRGGGELTIDEITTNCSCSGLEREQDGRFVRLTSLRLKAGEKTELALRIAVGNVPAGSAMLNVVRFRTNDPTHPEGHIEAVVRCVHGGVSTNPQKVVVGTVPVGHEVRQFIDVRDKALKKRAIERVTSTAPDRVRVCWHHVEDEVEASQSHPEGPRIARIEVVVDTASPATINAQVEITLAGERRRS